jgi:hypothetical protein
MVGDGSTVKPGPPPKTQPAPVQLTEIAAVVSVTVTVYGPPTVDVRPTAKLAVSFPDESMEQLGETITSPGAGDSVQRSFAPNPPPVIVTPVPAVPYPFGAWVGPRPLVRAGSMDILCGFTPPVKKKFAVAAVLAVTVIV